MDIVGVGRIYLQVVEHQGFSRAAKQFKLNPSSVSRQMTQLEEYLGARLLNRSTRRLSVTRAGYYFYDRIKTIIADIDSLHAELGDMHSSAKGVLNISMPIGIGEQCIARWFPEFLQRYPEIQLQVSYSDVMVDLIEKNVDMVIRLGNPKDSTLIASKLSDIEFHLYASPAYLKKHGVPQTPEALTEHNCLIYADRATTTTWHFSKKQQAAAITVKGNFCTTNTSALLSAAKQGVGVSLLSSWTAANSVKEGELQKLLPDYKVNLRGMNKSGVYLLYPHRKHLGQKARAFIDFIKEKIATLQ